MIGNYRLINWFMKRKHLCTLFLLISLFLLKSSLNAQSFDSVLLKLDGQYPQEKLYAHFDKNYYSPGETIWFKAYLFSAQAPTLTSRTLYAELMDEEGKVIQRKTAPIISSGAAAAFDLPAGITSSLVFVRIYTRWMLNFDSSFLFLKAIPIVTARKENAKPHAKAQSSQSNASAS